MKNTAPIPDAQRRRIEEYLSANRGQHADSIERRPERAIVPLSIAQEEIWRRERRVPDIPPLYNECITLHIAGPLDASALEAGFNEVIRRHEAWRTSFKESSGQPVQIVNPPWSASLPVVDLRAIAPSAREQEAVRRVAADATRPFDLERGPLIRPTLVRMSENEHRLYLIVHQIIIDGLSAYRILPLELNALYRAFSRGKPSPLPESPIQFGDFTYWQRRLRDNVLGTHVEYWRKQLAGAPVLNWPAARPRPAEQTFRGAIQPFAMPGSLSGSVKRMGRDLRATLFTVLLTGFAALLRGYTSQEDIVVGTYSPAGRMRTEVQGLLGYFLNPVALRISAGDDPAFDELVQRAGHVLSAATCHDEVPVERIAKALQLQPDPSRSAFFTVAISLQPPVPDVEAEWSVTSMDVASGGASWDLYLAFIDRPEGILGRAQYNPDVFEPPEIDTMLKVLEGLLGAAAADPGRPVSELYSSACSAKLDVRKAQG